MKNYHFRIIVVLLGLLIFSKSLAVHASGYKMAEADDCVVVGQNDQINKMALGLKNSYNNKNNLKLIKISESIIEQYQEQAQKMQNNLKEYAWANKEEILSYDALNIVSLALYWQARAFLDMGEEDKAKTPAKRLINDFYYGQCGSYNGQYGDGSFLGFAKPAFSLEYKFENFKNLRKTYK